jgi:hypothetical protein
MNHDGPSGLGDLLDPLLETRSPWSRHYFRELINDNNEWSTVEAEVLRPEVIEASLQEAQTRLRPDRDTVARRQAEGQATLARLEAECGQLTEAIAAGGELPSLLAGLKARERERRQVEQDLAGLAQLERVTQLDWQQVGRDLRDRLTDWQGLLQRQPAQAQQILRTLLVGRLVFTPKCDVNGEVFWEFAGEGRLDPLLDPLLVGVVGVAPKPGGSPWSHSRISRDFSLFLRSSERWADTPATPQKTPALPSRLATKWQPLSART